MAVLTTILFITGTSCAGDSDTDKVTVINPDSILHLSGLDSEFPPSEGSLQTAQELKIECNVDWKITISYEASEASIKNEWLIISKLEGSGDAIIKVYPKSNNNSYSRSATIIVTAGSLQESIEVKQTYGKFYTYEFECTSAIAINTAERTALDSELSSIVGSSTTKVFDILDLQKKYEFEKVINKYQQTVKSVYLKYMLVRYTHDTTVAGKPTQDVIGSYELGLGLKTPFVTYYMNSEEESVYKAFEGMQEQLGDSLYMASYATLYALLGRHSTTYTIKDGFISFSSTTHKSEFDLVFEKKNVDKIVYEDGRFFTNYISSICDSVANSHAADPLPLKVVLSLAKRNVVTGYTATIWTKTMEPNIKE